MSDTADWKEKYRTALLEMQADELRWGQIELTLRRLVGRLCAAGMGVNPRLDDELTVLAAANRRNADVAELEILAASLTTTVAAVDAVSPVLHRPDATCAAVEKILRSLRTLSDAPESVDALIGQLPAASTDARVATLLESAADLVRHYGESLLRERGEATALLDGVTKRLEEMSDYLAGAGRDLKSRFEDSTFVNETVIAKVQELTIEVNRTTDLQLLRSVVNSRLEAVTEQVSSFRQREETRALDQTSRVDRMRARIDDLERETRDLNHKLDREKHGARLDPLTRLANRMSFDERISAMLGRPEEERPAVTLMLWDIDNFKFINDTYGHRAGDRVLQNVAACLQRGLRSEDFIARIGGEEFVVLLHGIPFPTAERIADELRAGVEALAFHFRGAPVRVTVSCGLTDLRAGDTAGTLFDRADQALYRAKGGGKNVCIAA